MFAVLLSLTGISVSNARKGSSQKNDNTALVSERHEIGNFDFLYNDGAAASEQTLFQPLCGCPTCNVSFPFVEKLI